MAISIGCQKAFLHEIFERKYDSFELDEITLILIALRDTGLPFSFFQNLECNIANSGMDCWQKHAFQRLKTREETISAKETITSIHDDWAIYENILRAAFRLNFRELKEALYAWQPKSRNKLFKAVWMSLFDFAEYEKFLEEFISDTKNSKEEYWATEFLTMSPLHDYSRLSMIKYINMGFSSLSEVKACVINQRINLGRDIGTYKHNWQPTMTHIEKSEDDYTQSMKVLQFFMDFPCMPSIGKKIIVSAEEWYDTFKSIYEIHPFPALFYSLFISDEAILQKIGLDLAYSDSLYEKGIIEYEVKELFDK